MSTAEKSMSTKIRIILADDHAVVRDGIVAVIQRLAENITIVGEAATGKEVIELAQDKAVDVFVLDVEMPKLDGIETINRLSEHHGPVKVVLLSMYDEKILVERAIRAGAQAYILKESAAEEIVKAIEEVYAGGYFFSPKISGYLAQEYLHEPRGKALESLDTTLTTRQTEILKRVCQGLTEKEIAYQLNISPNTVHVHINNFMNKVQIHNKAGLIKYAIKMGFVQL
jgi:DNA-binding NarL/FixJ family response regulator